MLAPESIVWEMHAKNFVFKQISRKYAWNHRRVSYTEIHTVICGGTIHSSLSGNDIQYTEYQHTEQVSGKPRMESFVSLATRIVVS
jgi:hypothetical protein